MEPLISKLCPTCSAIDFPTLVWPHSVHNVLAGPDPIPLGTTEEIRDRSLVCELCRLIVVRMDQITGPDIRQNPGDQCQLQFSKLEEEVSPDGVLHSPGEHGTSRFLARAARVEVVPVTFNGFMGPVMPDRFYTGVENPTARETTVEARPWTLLCLQGCTYPVPTVEQLCNGNYDLLDPPKCTRFSGRLRKDTVNPLLCRHWLELCRRHHGDICWNQQCRTIQGLRVIDVQDMAVRLAPKHCEFAALSYCWGSAKTTLLTTENVDRFTAVQSLNADILPNTIVDAIDVTRNAGIRYLWVDALCIVQDDPVALQSQIPQMARIYAQAVFTIVAAVADTADHGLAGVRLGSRTVSKDVINMSDMSLIAVPEIFLHQGRHMELRGCRWRSRAWTLQEELFSKRRLFFNTDRVLWQCSSSTYHENTVKEISANYIEDDEDSDFTFEVPWLTKSATELDLMWYEQFVSEYSTRRLSFAADTLNALAGLCEEISQSSGISFTWGHPDRWFVQSLLWQTNYECARNAGTQRTTTPGGTEILTPFPTWSWSAWVGNLDGDNVHYPGYAFNLLDLVSFTILIYRCRLDAQLRSVPCSLINATDLLKSQQTVPEDECGSHEGMMPRDWIGSPRLIVLPEEEGSVDVIDSGRLQFWSSVANVYIGHYISKDVRQPCHYDVLNSRGETVVHKANVLSTAMLDWNDLARYDRYPTPILKSKHRYAHGLHEIHAVAVTRSEAYHFSVTMMVSVLLVVQEGPIFSRIGTATMTNTHWLGLEPNWSSVTLG